MSGRVRGKRELLTLLTPLDVAGKHQPNNWQVAQRESSFHSAYGRHVPAECEPGDEEQQATGQLT
jgi:hypothetical protein